MTTIILVIIGILIAAAAALFVIFYGGDAFSGSSAKAEATTIVSQATQINAATTAFRVENGRYPGDANGANAMEELISSKYLKNFPSRPGGKQYNDEWKIDYERGIARTTLGAASDPEAAKVCTSARQISGFSGTPKSCDDPSISDVDPCCTMSSSQL